MDDFKPGDLVIYCPITINRYDEGDIEDAYVYKAELGIVKRVSDNPDVVFVYYTSGDTASATNRKDLVKLENYYYLKDRFECNIRQSKLLASELLNYATHTEILTDGTKYINVDLRLSIPYELYEKLCEERRNNV